MCDPVNEDWSFYAIQCYLNTTDPEHPRLESECYGDRYCRNQVFCEDYLFLPEWVSFITALWISIMGLYQLAWDHPIEIIRFLSTCIFANGIFSSMNHYTGALIFSYLDNCTMYLAVYVLFAIALSKFLTIVPFLVGTEQDDPASKKYKNCKGPRRCCLKFGLLIRFYYASRYGLRWLCWVFAVGMIIANLYNDWQYEPSTVFFVVSFALPLVVLAGIVWFITHENVTNQFLWMRFAPDSLRNAPPGKHVRYTKQREKEIPIRLRRLNRVMEFYLARGMILCICSAALWLSTESICATWEWPRYIMGHGFWHIFMAYGLSLLLLFMTYLECTLRGINVYVTDLLSCESWEYCCQRKDSAREATFELADDVPVKRLKCFVFPIIYVMHPNEATSDEIQRLFDDPTQLECEVDSSPRTKEEKGLAQALQISAL